ncbi:P-loop containing nucleoside triphosphate hydrolase protein [Hysterangium stoloniferum]|nr:P-loop containing nucleoside triphosphate hydrolase protein [Hysterangium stoloniferum]
MSVDAIDIAEEIRNALPGTEETIVQYLAGYLVDDAAEDEDTFHITRNILESAVAEGHDEALDRLLTRLSDMLEEQIKARSRSKGPVIRKLGNVMDMSKAGAMSNTIAFSEGVDLESINKSKASRVDVKKLEKQEAKLRAKIEKRAKRDLYEGSKLLESQRKQQSYEEVFMKVNSLEAAASSKGKSKDIHLPAIDVTFGSNRILTGASLTLASGRRYGLIGRNGVGKSTLLRHIALREVPVPAHITILFVEQEIIGDDTLAIDSVLKADVWRDHLLREERVLNDRLASLEKEGDERRHEDAREEAEARLAEVHERLADMEAETGPARAAALLAGLGFSESDQQRPTKLFSGGWRMRLALARALFVKPNLLLLDEPSNHIDLNALAWLEDYLQTWPGTILVVSHDRAFLDAVATDIVHQHSNRLDYYKGNFTQFYATKSERDRNMRKEYENQVVYRQHLQAFIDRWRYNANRGSSAQAQMKIKILEKLPDLEPPPSEDTEKFRFPDAEKISPPLLQLSNVTFGYTEDRPILSGIDIDVGADSRIAVVGANGAGKSTLIKLLTGELAPLAGQVNRNGRVRVAYFAQHHVDALVPSQTPVAFLASKFPGKSEQEYRNHLGSFGLTGGLQLIGTLSGGQKSRVAFAALSLQNPHILLLDEPTNHLDIEGLDALMTALSAWNGGVILISHDERFITTVAKELWVCADGTVSKFSGDVQSYKKLIVSNINARP